MTGVFPPELAPTLIAFALLPLFQQFFPTAAPKPALHLVGTTGSGKSEVASLMTSLYGQFSRDTPPAQWGDTVNTVEFVGVCAGRCLVFGEQISSTSTPTNAPSRAFSNLTRAGWGGAG